MIRDRLDIARMIIQPSTSGFMDAMLNQTLSLIFLQISKMNLNISNIKTENSNPKN
jgi:hypothetical protein